MDEITGTEMAAMKTVMGNNGSTFIPYAVNGNNGGYDGFGGGFGWLGWIVAMMMFGGGMGGYGFGGGGQVVPWAMMNGLTNGQDNTDDLIVSTSNHAETMGAISALTGAVNGVSRQICDTAMNTETAANTRHLSTLQQLFGNQIANMQQLFGVQTDIGNRMDGISERLLECCCDAKQQTAELKYVTATEAAETRANCTNNTQKVLDKLCQLELDGVRAERDEERRNNIALQNALNMSALRESQSAQNNYVQNALIALAQYLRPQPVPAYPAYAWWQSPPSDTTTGGGTTT